MAFELHNLANEFANFQLSEELKNMYCRILNMPVQFARMITFVNEAKINNESIDYWMAFKPARQEDESFDDYKNRRTFQNKLLKYRKHLYNYELLHS